MCVSGPTKRWKRTPGMGKQVLVPVPAAMTAHDVDEIGRAYGLQEEDTGALRSGGEVLSRRDRHRVELRAPAKPGV